MIFSMVCSFCCFRMILVGFGLENSFDRDDFMGITRRKIPFFQVVLFVFCLFFFSFVSWFDIFFRFSMIQKYFISLFFYFIYFIFLCGFHFFCYNRLLFQRKRE